MAKYYSYHIHESNQAKSNVTNFTASCSISKGDRFVLNNRDLTEILITVPHRLA